MFMQQAVTAAGNWARLGWGAAKGQLGARTQTTMLGAIAGAGWGVMSNDTSVLGGALIGAGIGRYGGAGLRRGRFGYRGIGVSGAQGKMSAVEGFVRGVWNRGSMDFRSARMMANQGYSKIKGLYRR